MNTADSSPTWNIAAMLSSAGTFLAGLSLSEWMAIMGFFGMVLSLLMAWLKYRNDLKLFQLDMQIKQAELEQMTGRYRHPLREEG